MRTFRKQSGFTIVELLIVIVVIGILAGIALVAYNGIAQNARVASLTSDLESSYKKLQLYQVDNSGSYPIAIDCSTTPAANTTCLKPSNGTTFTTYLPNTSTTPQTYCLTATTANNTNYYITQDGVSTGGACGITNLAVNPSLETNLNGWQVANWQGGAGTVTRDTLDSSQGVASHKMTWTTSSTLTNAGIITTYAPVVPGSVYTFSAYVKPSTATTIGIVIRQYLAANGTGTSLDTNTTNVNVPANTWTRVSRTLTIPSGYNSAMLRLGLGYVAVAGDTYAVDGFMVTQGNTLYTYADGSSAGWSWTGTANASTSTGLPL
jgi:prepilin-type N-terminal cleavage/methylation domain-containing protein